MADSGITALDSPQRIYDETPATVSRCADVLDVDSKPVRDPLTGGYRAELSVFCLFDMPPR